MSFDLRAFPEFKAESWRTWRERVLDRITPTVRSVWVAAGRGSGKSRVAGLLAASYAVRTWPHAPGERIYCVVVAPTREQAKITYAFAKALIPPAMFEDERAESLDLKCGTTLQVVTASVGAPRGRSYALAILEEAAFLPSTESVNPDTEVLRALRPGLMRVPGSLLVVVSSPWAQRGELWAAHQRWAATGGDEANIYVNAPTQAFNPTADRKEIDRAMAEDPVAAATEFGAAFRSDCETLLSWDTLRAVSVAGRRELAPEAGRAYSAFADPSGGSSDSFTWAVAHSGAGGIRVLDLVREVRPPFSPETTVEECCQDLRRYGIGRVTGDHYSGEFVRELFKLRGVTYEVSERTKSELYLELVSQVNTGRVELLDDERLLQQLASLERRTSRGTGRETVDAPPRSHEDRANAVAGALVGAWRKPLTVRYEGSVMEGTLRSVLTGTDSRGREWRDGQPWNGRFSEFAETDMKNRLVRPVPTYVDGVLQPHAPSDWCMDPDDPRLSPRRRVRGLW